MKLLGNQQCHICVHIKIFFLRDILFDIPLPITLDDNIFVFKYSSFSRDYRVYKERWQLAVDDDSLHCEKVKHNEYDKHAVAVGVNWPTNI